MTLESLVVQGGRTLLDYLQFPTTRFTCARMPLLCLHAYHSPPVPEAEQLDRDPSRHRR